MANICSNWIEVFGEADTLNQIAKDYDEFEFEMHCDSLISSYDSRWSPPLDELQAISNQYEVVLECEYDEAGSDVCGKIGYQNGEVVFHLELPYLQGRYVLCDWNEFVECYVMGIIDQPFDDFMSELEFCTDEEKIELEELFFENAN